MAAIVKFLTPARRKAIYGVVAAGIACMLAFNVISPDQLNTGVETVLRIVTALTALMAFLNTNVPTEDIPFDDMPVGGTDAE